MSIQTAIPLTPDQAQAQSVLARRRALINQKAASIQVNVIRNGQTVTVFLNSLPPVERARAIQNLMNVGPVLVPLATPTAAAPAAPAPPAPATAAPAIPERKASRYTTRTKKTTTSATKKAQKKK